MGVVHETILPRQRNHEDLGTFTSDDDPVFLDIASAIRAETSGMYRGTLNFLATKFPPNELFQSHDDDLHRFLELSQWKQAKNHAEPAALAYLDEHFANHGTLLGVGEGVLDAKALYQCMRSNGRPVLYFSTSHFSVKIRQPSSLWGSLVYQLLSHKPHLYSRVKDLAKVLKATGAWTTLNAAKIFGRLLSNAFPTPNGFQISDAAGNNAVTYVLIENLPFNDPEWEVSAKCLHSLQGIDSSDGLEESNKTTVIKLVLLYDRRTLAAGAADGTPWAEAKVVDPVTVFGNEPLRKFSEALATTWPSKAHREQYKSLILDQCGYNAEEIYGLRAVIEKNLAKLDLVIPDTITRDFVWETLESNVNDAFRFSPPWAKAAIGWVLCSKRPLTQDELWAGIQLSSSNRSIPDMARALKAIYGTLICATAKRICFPNKAIRGYFHDSLSREKDHLGDDWPKLEIPGDSEIVDVLISCIVTEENDSAPQTALHLKAYAAEFWRQHLEDAQVDTAKVLSLAANTEFMSVLRKQENDSYWARFKSTKSLDMTGPLVLAAQIGIPRVVTDILEDTTSAREIGSAVTMAARYNNSKVVEVLLASTKLSDGYEADDAVNAALEIAVVHHCTAVYNPILGWLEGPANVRSRRVPAELLHLLACHAATFGYLELLQLLVRSYGAKVDLPTGQVSPLCQAVRHGNVNCTKFLVQEAGAVIYNAMATAYNDVSNDSQSATSDDINEDIIPGDVIEDINPILVAAQRGYTDIVAILLDETAIQIDGDSNGESTASCEADGSRKTCVVPWSMMEDAMIAACSDGHIETVKHILQHPTVAAVPQSHRRTSSDLLCSAIRAEPQAGADSLAMVILKSSRPTEHRQDLVLPFIRAAEFGQLEFIKFCFTLDDPNAEVVFTNGSDRNDRMALHCAAGNGLDEIVRCLLLHKADPNVTDGTNLTPLALAVLSGHADTVQILLENRADVSWVGPATRGILASAAMSRNCEQEVRVVQLLLKHRASVNALDGSKHTALHWAAQRGHINILEVLLTHDGIDVTMTGDRDMNALHSAAQSPARTAKIAAEMLIAAGISTDKADVDGWLPLHLAAGWNSVEMTKFLLGNDTSRLHAVTTNGDTVLHAAYKTCEVLIWLLDEGFDVDTENHDGKTVLMHAAKNGVDQAVGLLLAFGADTDLLDRSGRSALHHAVETKSLEVARKLLDANPAVLFHVDSSGASILHTAITRGLMSFALDVLNELETYSKENDRKDDMVQILNAAPSSLQRSPLIHAVRRGNEEVVAKMVALGADIEMRDYRAESALSYAIERNNENIVRLLLESLLRDSKNSEGERSVGDAARSQAKKYAAPLQVAAGTGNMSMVDLILGYGVDVNEESGQLNTALTAAAAGGCSEVVRKLLERQADPLRSGGSYPNALSAAVSSSSTGTVDLLLEKNKSAALARDVQGRNALQVAVQSRALDAFEKILSVVEELSADGSRAALMPFGRALDPDKQGRRLLHFAASSGDVDTLRYFLEHPRLHLRSEIDILDNDGWTPLHWACRPEGGAEAVGLLLACGSDPSMETRDGWTPLNIAQYHDSADTLLLLEEALKDHAEKVAERKATRLVSAAAGTEGDVVLVAEAIVESQIYGRPLARGYSNWGITCDGCMLEPAIGACYQCLDCADYDFCFKCHWSAETTHFKGHRWKQREGTVDPRNNRQPPYQAPVVNRVRSRARSREPPMMAYTTISRIY
ncbi:hypothetical protein SPBR_06333 [Sporothrix brasiliensis 5110]|uniref:ZZ-type domain-containing protein n=1 Tax=Sporothrix brasiliensis 5110 TaxID=1398154 RepID=A0A0C2IFZ0_9PEZI|nr:uncharacterized protein SPBR_06333 [Sporothrix brasiliensis 5110]KIH88116.1 hypothetical protein SPBR_06333 [Sporothrix brasiliensis 5110]